MVERLNQTFFSNNRIVNECSFPKTRNNYKGSTVESFHLSEDMPPHSIFEDINFIPNACTVLKTKGVDNNQKVFINILEHESLSKSSIDNPYVYIIGSNNLAGNQDGEGGYVVDVLINPSLWSSVSSESSGDDGASVLLKKQVCLCILYVIWLSCNSYLD